MNVLFVNATRKWGGEKSWALDTARTLSDAGHHCVMAGRRGNHWVDACARAGLASHGIRFGFDYNPVAIWRLLRLVRRHSIQCIVVNISKDLIAGCLAGAIAGVPVIRHVGSSWDLRDRWSDKWFHGRFLAGTVVVGHRMKTELLERLPWLAAADIEVIHLGKDTARYTKRRSDRLKREWGLPQGALLVGTTSQLLATKGHDLLLDAFARVAAERPHLFLALAGEGPRRAALEEQVLSLGLGERVRFLGFQRDVPEVLGNFDLYVLPSLAEGFPNTLVEALASGLPCISTELSCVPEMLRHGENGLLVPAGDGQALQHSLRQLVDDAGLRAGFGTAARQRIEAEFSLADKSAEFGAYLQRIVG